MSFHDVRLPKFIEVFATGQPEFATSLITTISGREVRSLDRAIAKHKYVIKNCRLGQAQFEEFNSFFRARRGQCFSFRFRDHADYQVTKQLIAYGDGKSLKFPLIKLYDDSILSYSRKITKPVQDTVKIYTEDQVITATIDYSSGIILMPQIFDKDLALFAEFIFDVHVRFCSDSFSYSYANDGSIELAPIELCEIVE